MTPKETVAAGIVCLVDDDPGLLQALGRLLASEGFAVRSFSDPKSFLAHAETHLISLVVLDIWMEQMNGLEVQAQLASLSPQTRVIIMTGRNGYAAEQAALQAGAAAFFIKPFDDEQFLAAVRRALA